MFPFAEDKSDENRESIEPEHGKSNNALSYHIGSRGDNSGNSKNSQNSIFKVFNHPPRSYQAHSGEKEDQRRQLKDKGDPQQNSKSQGEIFVHSDDCLEILAHGQKKTTGPGEDDEVAEDGPQEEENRGEQDEGDNIFFFMLIEAWSDKIP